LENRNSGSHDGGGLARLGAKKKTHTGWFAPGGKLPLAFILFQGPCGKKEKGRSLGERNGNSRGALQRTLGPTGKRNYDLGGGVQLVGQGGGRVEVNGPGHWGGSDGIFTYLQQRGGHPKVDRGAGEITGSSKTVGGKRKAVSHLKRLSSKDVPPQGSKKANVPTDHWTALGLKKESGRFKQRDHIFSRRREPMLCS